MTKKRKVLFVDYKTSNHFERFLSLFERHFEVKHIFFENFSKEENIENQLKGFDLLIYADFFQLHNFGIDFPIKKICISWTYDAVFAARNSKKVGDVFDLLIVDSFFSESLWLGLGVPGEKILRVPFGIDFDYNYDNSINRRDVISVRNWDENYNQDFILKSLDMIDSQSFKDQFYFAGSGPSLNSLREKYKHLESNGMVIFLGKLSNSRLRQLLPKFKLYISASKSDGSSISMLEAMAAKTPVLVSDIPANREWIEHSKNGFLFDLNSEEKLANQLRMLLKTELDLSNVVENAFELVRRKANWNSNSQLIIERIISL